MNELLAEHGFLFDSFCSICKNRYRIFKHPDKPFTEIKVHVSGNYFKLYQPDARGKIRQTLFGNLDKLKSVIATL